MNELNIVNSLHTATERDYLERVNSVDKAWAAEKASNWGYDYWDGSRQTGYGGYKYDGRWKKVAKQLVEKYQLGDGAKILDVGCGKGFLLHDLKSQNPKIEVTGIDVSAYAIENAMETVKGNCHIGCASELPFDDNSFDLVISINTLHNLGISKLWTGLSELGRVAKSKQFVCVESFRNEKEKVNLLYWQLTCRAFYTPDDWRFLFSRTGYTGDYEFIYFQ